MTPEQEKHLQHYLKRVAEAGILLVSLADRSRLQERHLAPSLAGLELLPETGKVLDIGSGGGFPAIPLATLTPQLSYTLVESNSRKAAFLGRVSRETELSQRVTVVNERVEVWSPSVHGGDRGGLFDCITARAVTELPVLAKWCRPLLARDGFMLFWKGREWRNEAWPEELGLKLLTELNLADGSRLIKLTIDQ
ncbi:MAG: 16S rRNA (guanine(527)-N(7))-methyltransferase RsmG [Calditrichaeota bacterium]|nr:16S rRNA (guanine(527)-N(7))-methyltransferase RsmG [Calditrichota bacterium]